MSKKDQTPAVVENEVVEDAITSQTVVSPDWPRDIHGFTSGFRREVARTVGRIRGNEEKMETFIAHLRAAADWARSRYEIGVAVQAKAVEEAEALRAALKVPHGLDQLIESDADRAAAQAAAGISGAVVNGA